MDSIKVLLALGLGVGLSAVAVPVHAGSKYQTTLVPNQANTMPGFSASGSSIKIDGHRMLKGKIKNVVDIGGNRVTTDPMVATDNYSVEMDLEVPATAATGTVSVSFDLKNGNGNFAADVSGDAVFSGAATGAGVAVNAVRVKDAGGTVIGRGGIAIE
jgi:hypothetical protein